MEKLIGIAKEILKLNPEACLTGTLMLKLRGIDLGREPKDIDILINKYVHDLIMPKEFKELEKLSIASDGCGCKYKYKDITIDVMSSGEIPELVDGIKLGTVKGLIDAKYIYSHQNNDSSKKHYDDLVKLGFKFPDPVIDDDELPF